MTTPNPQDDAETLARAAVELNLTVNKLRESIGEGNVLRDDLNKLIKQSSGNRKMIIWIASSVALDILLTFAIAFFGVQLNDVIKTQRDAALCPLYGIFISADTPENRARAESQGQDMEERQRAFSIIRNSYELLDCDEDLRN